MHQSRLCHKLMAAAVISLLLTMMGSCSSDPQEATSSPIPVSLPTSTLQSNAIGTATASPIPSVTKTQRAIPTTTWTPLATIAPNEIDAFVDVMNNKCELPCWGEMVPGKTSEWKSKQTLSSFASPIESTSFYFEYHQKPAFIDLTYKDGLVASINLPPELSAAYNLNDLLARFGMPEDVRIEVIPETAEGTSWFFLAVFFPQKGFFAIYSSEGRRVDSKVNACFEKVSPDLYLVEANKYSLEQINRFLDPTLGNILEPIESLTGINKEQFYEIYSQTTQDCLATTVQVP